MRTDFILRTGTRFLTAAVVALLVFLGADQTNTGFLLRVCLLLLPAAGTVLLEKWKKNPAYFYAGEFLLLFFALIGTDPTERKSLFFACLILVAASLLSAGAFARNLLDRPFAAEGVLFVAAYLAAGWKDAGYGYQFFLYFLGVGFLMAYFYWKNRHGREFFLDTAGNRVAEGQEEQIKRVNRKSLLPFQLLLLLIAALAWIPMGSRALTEAVENGYNDVMESINEMFEVLPEDFVIMFGEEPEGEGVPELAAPEAGDAVPEPAPAPVRDLRALEIFLNVLMFLLALLGVIALFLILRRFVREPDIQNSNGMQQEYQIDIAEKSTRFAKRKQSKKESVNSGSENHKIRRSYHGALGHRLRIRERENERYGGNRASRAKAGAEVRREFADYQTMTPVELERMAGLRSEAKCWESGSVSKTHGNQPAFRDDGSGRDTAREEKLLRLHELYEKARYGREACTREESREAESLAKGL